MTGTNRISIPWAALYAGTSLAGTYILCIVLDILFPGMPMRIDWGVLLPGFSRLTFMTFVLGLVVSFLVGVIFTVTIAPVYNLYFLSRDKLEEIQALRYNDRLEYF